MVNVVLIPSPVFPSIKDASATLKPITIEELKAGYKIIENKIRQVETVEFLRSNGVSTPDFSVGFWDGVETNVAVVARIQPTQGDSNNPVNELELAVFTYYKTETQDIWE